MSINHAVRFALHTALALVCSVGSVSAQQACSNGDFAGRYAFIAELESLRSGADKKYPVKIAGTLHSDGNGNVAEWMDTVVAGPPDQGTTTINRRNLVAAAAAAGSQLSYEVLPDCRITFQGRLAIPIGTVDIELTGALAYGGREVMVVQTSPDSVVGSAVFKSIDAPAQPQLKAMKELLDRIALRNGLRP